MSALSRGRDRQEIGEEIRSVDSSGENGSHLHDAHADLAAPVVAVRLRADMRRDSGASSIAAGTASALAPGLTNAG